MAGQEIVIKPSRSDEVLDPIYQLQITNQVKAHFDSMVPNRPSKPSRSDPDSIIPHDTAPTTIPELDKLQSLRSNTIFPGTNPPVAEDEFVETQYYKHLDSVDKQHHTTGCGFIKLTVNEGENDFLERGRRAGKDGGYISGRDFICKSNPATNDWIPSIDHFQNKHYSSKPHRSENC